MNSLHYKYKHLLLFFLLGIALSSCMTDDAINTSINTSNEYLKIRLNLPGMKVPSTRAMSYETENALDPNLFNVMILKENVISETSLVGPIIYDEEDRSKVTITVKLPKSTDDNDKIKICVIANYELMTPLPLYYPAFKYQALDLADKWDTSKPIPMWGESEEIAVNDATVTHIIDMHRALARIDVGLNFKSTNGKLTEEVSGLPNFKISSIYVHSTYTSGYVIPVVGLDTPNIPSDAVRRLWEDPLSFTSLGGVDSYVREIYVLDAKIPDPFDNFSMHSVVVGGFFEGSAIETFYRLDFAREGTGGTKENLPILRNHRYVFNIQEISGKGYDSRSLAFLNEGAISDKVIRYEVEELDESIHRIEFEGGYYFALDERNHTFEPLPGISSLIKYQTDLPTTEVVTLEWSNPSTGSARYNVLLDTGAKAFTIETLRENISGEVYTDTLHVKSGPFDIPILVQQKCVNFKYDISCENIAVSGVYVLGEALGASHYIDLSITAEDRTIEGKTYVIETEDVVGNHGISFSATGTFNFSSIPNGSPLVMNIRLNGTGTLPQARGSTPFKLRVKTNSGLGTFCEATIVPVESKMNIVVMSDKTNAHGYAIDRLNGGAGKVFNHPNNFGPYDYSIVKTAGFNYINANGAYNFGSSTSTDVYKWITGTGNNGKIADLVYIAYPAAFDANSTQLLMQYLDNGGVVVAFIEDQTTAVAVSRQLLGVSNIGSQATVGGGIFPLPANPALFANEADRENKLRALEGDPILNGPFGDIRDKQVGNDAYSPGVLTNIPANRPEVTIYANNNNINANPKVTNSTAVVGFKYESLDRNIFFWGDGGVMSSGYNGADGIPYTAGFDICPFWWNITTFFPVNRPSYGSNVTNRTPVYNSTMFCNIMAWAISKSQSLKAKRMLSETSVP